MLDDSNANRCLSCGRSGEVVTFSPRGRYRIGVSKRCDDCRGSPCRGLTIAQRLQQGISRDGPLCEHLGTRCWVWRKAKTAAGYGQMRIGKRPIYTHRLAFELSLSRPLLAQEFVCHHCDNPSCCNPDHLFLGDVRSNAADMVSKERSATGDRNGSRTHPERLARGDRSPSRMRPERLPRGECCNFAKLTESQVRGMRESYASGCVSRQDLAYAYGVSVAMVRLIILRKSWKHV